MTLTVQSGTIVRELFIPGGFNSLDIPKETETKRKNYTGIEGKKSHG